MIDLRTQELPSRLEWEGGSAVIDTSFRTWIEFDRMIREERIVWGGIFTDGVPSGDGWVEAAIKFWKSESTTPRQTRPQPNVLMVDFVQDGDHIVASFQQAYGIDLTVEDMHWHRFKALFNGLPDSTKMAKIMGYRDYNEQDAKRKYEDAMKEQRAAWSLPQPELEDDDMGGMGALLEYLGV